MFIKLKQKIKKCYAKILSKKISGFGILKFPSRKVLLGVFLMVMIFGGVFGGVGEARAAYPPPTYSEDQCFGNDEAACEAAAVVNNDEAGTVNPNIPLLKCSREAPYCLKLSSSFDAATGTDFTEGALDVTGKAIGMVLEKIANIVLAIVYGICWLLLHLAGLFVDLSAVFLHATLDSALYNDMFKSNMVSEGWIIVRDVCNMFFILILLVISLATILRIQTYKAQSLLLPLLIAAFLVNFSRPIVELAIDASQILMYQFVNMMGGSFIDSDVNQKLSGITDTFIGAFGGFDKIGAIVKGDLINAASWVIAIMFALVFLLVLAAVYTAMALFMIIRLVALTILIIFSPIGFFFNILPQTKSYASKYWSELSKYLIFGPVMAFFIYLAGHLAISVPADLESRLTQIATENEVLAVSAEDGVLAANKVLTEGGAVLVSLLGELLPYVVIMIFLYAAIWIARELGIAGADKVAGMTTGKLAAFGGMAGGAIGGAVGGYLGGAAGRAGSWTAKKADSASGGRLRRAKEYLKTKPGGSGIIAVESKIKAKQRKKTEEYESTLSSQSSDVVRARGNSVTANPEESAAAIRILAARDDLDKEKDKKLFEKAKRGGVDTDAIYTRMPTLAGNKDDKRKELERISEEGKLSQISAKSFEDKDIMDIFTKEFSTDKIKTVYKNGTTKQQEAMEEGLKEGFEKGSKAFSIDDTKKRKLFAGLTGKVKEAFEVSPGKGTPAGAIVTMEYVGKMKAADVGNVKEKEDLEIISSYLKVGVLDSIRGELSDEQKKIIKVSIQNNKNKKGSPEETFVNNSPGWAV